MMSSSSLPKSTHFSPREVHEAHPHRRHAAGRTTTPRVASFDPHRRPLLWSAPETSSSCIIIIIIQKKCQTLLHIRVWNAPRICVFFLRDVHFYATHVDTHARVRPRRIPTDGRIDTYTSSSCLHHRRLCITRRRAPRASRWRRHHHRHHAARGRWRRRQHPNAPPVDALHEPRRWPWRTRDGWPRCNNRCDEKFPT